MTKSIAFIIPEVTVIDKKYLVKRISWYTILQ